MLFILLHISFLHHLSDIEIRVYDIHHHMEWHIWYGTEPLCVRVLLQSGGVEGEGFSLHSGVGVGHLWRPPRDTHEDALHHTHSLWGALLTSHNWDVQAYPQRYITH